MDIAVIIPCYNHAQTLERAVRSALQQSHVTQIVIVDDLSSDGSAACARGLCAADQRVQLDVLERNSGPGTARNRGVALANASHILFLDADDELVGDFAGLSARLFEQNPSLIVVKCEVEFFDPIKGYILPAYDPRHTSAILSSSCGMVMERSRFLHMGGFPQGAEFRGPMGGEDVAFMQAVMAHFQPIARVEQVGYRVWSRPGSHLDKFLALTRLNAAGSFEYVPDKARQIEADRVAVAVKHYLDNVAQRLSSTLTNAQ